MQRNTVIIGLLVFAACLAGAVGFLTSSRQTESRWSSDFGPLTLRVDAGGAVFGTYEDYDGRIDGVLYPDLRLIAGYWRQATSESPCAIERDGTKAWGQVEFSLEGDRIFGIWSYCDDALSGERTWDAGLVGGVHPLAATVR